VKDSDFLRFKYLPIELPLQRDPDQPECVVGNSMAITGRLTIAGNSNTCAAERNTDANDTDTIRAVVPE